MRKKHKHLKRLCIVLSVLVLLIAAAAIYQAVALRPFWETAEKAFVLPGTDDARFDGQAIAFDTESGCFLFSGYMRDGSADPVYIKDPSGVNPLRRVMLLTDDGSPFTGHMGGIAVSGEWIYAAGSSDCCLYVYKRSELFSANDGDSIRCAGVFPTQLSDTDGIKVSFLTLGDGMIYVGEFHLPLLPPYRLRENHRITADGETTSALMAAFRVDPSCPFGLEGKPVAAYCLPDMVQGVTVTDGRITLSRSFAFVLSEIRHCEPVETGMTMRLMEADVPLYTLKRTGSLKTPPMAEEIENADGKIYITSELQNFLIRGIGNLWDARWCYAVPARN